MKWEVKFHGTKKSGFEEWNEETAITCNCCGHHTMNKYTFDSDSLIQRDTLCFTCGFWLEKAAMHKRHWRNAIPVLCDSGIHYIIRDPVDFTQINRSMGLGVGHGGRDIKIEIYNGDYIGVWESNNVWSQGEVPEFLKSRFENLGKMI